ncbi:MAG: SprB repeat-containing protein [Lewinellaceae bacterium]|nr:SprB repeat-containing protein [Lewinellaceae bacterium]
MKKTGLLISLLFILLIVGKNSAQSLACNDLIQVALDENCTYTLVPDDVLEGTIFSDCVVELDKTVPFGTGPWVAPVLGQADIGNTYMVRVKHVPSGNICWGNVKVEDKLPPLLACNGLSTIDLNGPGPLTVSTADLSITAADACGATTLAPATVQYDCANLGVNTLQLSATDAYGNTSTCLHSVLVTNSANCETCVNECPESVTVTYDEGSNNLYPAFQNNDWSAFDTFGNALFDMACTYVDSTYTVDFQVGTAGQSWFLRQWQWTDGAGQSVTCEQSIVFPTTHTVTVQGRVYLDTDDDCISDAGEQGVQHFVLTLTKLPSGVSDTIYPAPDGTYAKDILFSVLDVSAQLHLVLPANVNPVCPTALNIPNSTATPTYNFDMGLQSNGDCPIMQVDLGNLFTRRCATNFFKVNYCNVGLDTAYGAFVTVNLDPLISLESADLPFTVAGPDNIYTFQLGDVPPFHCGSIGIHAMVSCDAVPGQTLCNEAYIFPDVPCNGAWQGPLVTAKTYCLGDSVGLELKNTGLQNMTAPLNYIVIEDFIMYKDGPFQLDAGDAITIKTPANGATWRIEAEQTPGFPVPGLVAAAIEGCGGLNTPGLINVYAQSDNAITYDQDCSEVVASCDPNDKTAVPLGFGDQHLIRANEVIEYKIRFQNTGTDTAFQVVIVDTLSPLLDARTLETGASSHPYHLEIYPGGILHFVFRPIALPDSNINEVASHGYVKYKIAQQPDLPDGTVIENTAAIYFDENEPVFTNTAFHTIGYPFVHYDSLVYSAQTRPPSCNGFADGAIFIQVTGGVTPYSFHWSNPNLQGDSLTGLPAGTYQLTLTDSHGGQLLRTFELIGPAPLVLTMNSTPALANENNGAASAAVSGGTGTYTYLWNTGATTESISNLPAGTYTVVVTDANGCTQANSVVVEQAVATDEPGILSRIQVWPNPAHDRIMLDLHRVLPQLLRLDVLSADGRVLQQFRINELQPLLALNLENDQTGGLILLVLHGRDGSMFTEKIVVR